MILTALRARVFAAVLLWGGAAVAGAVELEPCTLYGASGASRIEAECITLDRPLDPTNAQSNSTIEVRVAVVRSLAPDPARDALTLINGGPGGSSIEMYADLAPLLTGILRERDIVIVDQRGTGASTPLRCEELDATQTETTADAETIRRAARRCLDELPADPRYFTTSVAVADLDAIREILGYDQWTLYGVSYGTRVAQHYARRHPERTRALIIDGVVPLPEALGPNVAINAQQTLSDIFERCQAEPACATAFPRLEQEFATLGQRLKDAAAAVELAHPITGEPQTLELTYGHLAVALRLGSYAPETASLIPLQIHLAASAGNYTPVAAQALQVIDQLTSTMAYGMHNAVVCTEDQPFYDFDPVALREQLEATYLGPEQVDAIEAICSVWPEGVIDPNFTAPLESDVPTLLLSGEFDPITPPANAEAVLPGLTNARHLVAPGQGHGVIARGCVPRLLRQFIEQPQPQALDAECLDRMAPDPFFIDLMGPSR